MTRPNLPTSITVAVLLGLATRTNTWILNPVGSNPHPADRPKLTPKSLSDKEEFSTVQEMQLALGSGSTLIRDDASGQVIGVEARGSSDGGIIPFPGKPGSHKSQSQKGSTFSVTECCRTRELYFMNSTLVDYFGKSKTIAQRSHIGAYQFIRHGMCGNKGSCPGSCQEIKVTVPLMIHPTSNNQEVTFGFFKIPGYCTCRITNLSRSRSVTKGRLLRRLRAV